MFIDIGKNTAGFVSGHSAKHVDQDLCFSLVTSDQVKSRKDEGCFRV